MLHHRFQINLLEDGHCQCQARLERVRRCVLRWGHVHFVIVHVVRYVHSTSLTFHRYLLSTMIKITNPHKHNQSINQMNKSCTSRNNRRHIHSLLLRPPSLQQHTSNTPFTTLPSPTSIQLRHHAPTVQKIHSSTNQQAIGGIG
jgi:hypothetical protein